MSEDKVFTVEQHILGNGDTFHTVSCPSSFDSSCRAYALVNKSLRITDSDIWSTVYKAMNSTALTHVEPGYSMSQVSYTEFVGTLKEFEEKYPEYVL